MSKSLFYSVAVVLILGSVLPPLSAATRGVDPDLPHLRRDGGVVHLVVDGKPFLILGGELHNSSASSLKYMEPIWPRLAALNLNTVLVPVSWELVEPEEGAFDFTLVDGLLDGARRNHLRLVILWFGSWKNGESSYVPGWVKRDVNRFPRMQVGKDRHNKEVLSALASSNRDADAKAFSALMHHLRQTDGQAHTVLMVQVENEVGLHPEPRDLSQSAQAEFDGPVPAALLDYLRAHANTLTQELKAAWSSGGSKTSGTWAEVFGGEADECFMAWHMARYINAVAEAGKNELPIPMYANAWLVQKPTDPAGRYPSGGPVSKMMDVWHAAAPSIDFLAPDIYLPDFDGVCDSYTRGGNPLFVPEATPAADVQANAFDAFAKYNAIGFSPFGIDSLPIDHPIGDAYALLHQLAPTIAMAQGTGKMLALRHPAIKDSLEAELPGYRLDVSFKLGGRDNLRGTGIIVEMKDGEFLVAGQGMEVGFSATTPGPRQTRIQSIDEGHFNNGIWVPGRRLNGDESGNDFHAVLAGDSPTMLWVKTYRRE